MLVLLAGCQQRSAPAQTTNEPPARPTYTPTPQPDTAGITSPSDPTPSPTEQAKDLSPLTVAFEPAVPEYYVNRLLPMLGRMTNLSIDGNEQPIRLLDQPDRASVRLTLVPLSEAAHPLTQRFYAVVVPFATVRDDVSLDELAARWQGNEPAPLLLGTEESQELAAIFGASPSDNVQITPAESLLTALKSDSTALGILPFDQLDPRYKVLRVDGVNVLSNQLDPATYPLAIALDVQGKGADLIAQHLEGKIQPVTNRDASRLTTLIMTGVTAMSRSTAAKMEAKGYVYPAQVISDTLSAADITHVSNEVPFLSNCQVNDSVDNLVLCSHPNYWAALEAIGTDIVGLSGNHVNDFGRDGARESLQFYRDQQIPIYGSGLNIEEACAPLLWEHNGNRFAFIAALAFWPQSAWATEDQPGACYYYDNKELILETIQKLRSDVDIISVELQYLETYNPYPTNEQVKDFRELKEAGVDIVTGVQSHVPQAMEPYGPDGEHRPGIIVYGLGNLFFDQMWSWPTRTELIARHTIYEGRVISTEILTAVLEDYAQPRWATPEERAEILQRIFSAAPSRPKPSGQ
jgi:poly-gamma-glutamate synthesis protein (capsule biosynthesis protein)